MDIVLLLSLCLVDILLKSTLSCKGPGDFLNMFINFSHVDSGSFGTVFREILCPLSSGNYTLQMSYLKLLYIPPSNIPNNCTQTIIVVLTLKLAHGIIGQLVV